MKLVPAGATLEVEATVLNRDVGFLEIGQEVQVKLDTFAFTKYGSVTGRVMAVSSDAGGGSSSLGRSYRDSGGIGKSDDGSGRQGGTAVAGAVGNNWRILERGQRRVIDYVFLPVLKAMREAGRER